MKAFVGVLGALIVAAALAPHPATAGVLFDNGAPIPGSGGSDFAEFNPADHFKLSDDAVITGGSFAVVSADGVLPTDLSYTFFANAADGGQDGPPGEVLATGHLNILSTSFLGDPGLTPHFNAIFALEGAFAAKAGTTYWFGIESPSFLFDFGWASSAFFPARGFYESSKFDDPREPPIWRAEDPSLAFTLTGTAVPEPGAWALLILGFGSVGAALRSRRRDAQAAGLGLQP